MFSCRVWSCLALSFLLFSSCVLSGLVLSCFVLSRLVLSCRLSCLLLSCLAPKSTQNRVQIRPKSTHNPSQIVPGSLPKPTWLPRPGCCVALFDFDAFFGPPGRPRSEPKCARSTPRSPIRATKLEKDGLQKHVFSKLVFELNFLTNSWIFMLFWEPIAPSRHAFHCSGLGRNAMSAFSADAGSRDGLWSVLG